MKDARGLLIIHLHVDNSLVFWDNDLLLQAFEAFIKKHYSLKWTHKPTLHLGIKLDFNEDNSRIKIFQPHYIEMVLERFYMVNCKTARTPLPQKHSLMPAEPDEDNAAHEIPYQQLVGCLQWILSSTRTDIVYAVSQLSRLNSVWSVHHWTAAKHILRYLKGTQDFGIT